MIIGIDPGKTGAIAMLYQAGHPKWGKLYIEDMPVLGKEINGAAFADILEEFPPIIIYIEAVNSRLMGRQSAFNFGQGIGVLKGVIAAKRISYCQVSPAKWKSHFKLPADKDAARAKATQLFPANADLFKRKKDDGRAEAALIALYAQQTGGRA